MTFRVATEKTLLIPKQDNVMSWLRPELGIVAIIPLYNGARYIEEALNSVLKQILLPSEIIVVDDGSADDGAGIAIVERMARDNPITLLHKPNGGQSSARNVGVRESSSKLIAFLDQDDIWYEDHLLELVGPFQYRSHGSLGWTYSNLDRISEDGALVTRSYLGSPPTRHPKRQIHKFIAEDMFILPSAALINREAFEAVGGFDERLCGYEDDDLFLRIFSIGYSNIYLDISLSKWRIYPGSTSYTPRMKVSRAIFTRKLLEIFSDQQIDSWARSLIVSRFSEHAIRDYNEAVRLRDSLAIVDAKKEIYFLIKYNRSIMINLFRHMVVHYRDALTTGNVVAVDFVLREMVEMLSGRLWAQVALRLLQCRRFSKIMFVVYRIVKPAVRRVF